MNQIYGRTYRACRASEPHNYLMNLPSDYHFYLEWEDVSIPFIQMGDVNP